MTAIERANPSGNANDCPQPEQSRESDRGDCTQHQQDCRHLLLTSRMAKKLQQAASGGRTCTDPSRTNGFILDTPPLALTMARQRNMTVLSFFNNSRRMGAVQ